MTYLAGCLFSKLCDQKTSSQTYGPIWTEIMKSQYFWLWRRVVADLFRSLRFSQVPLESNCPRRTLEEPFLAFSIASLLEDSLSCANRQSYTSDAKEITSVESSPQVGALGGLGVLFRSVTKNSVCKARDRQPRNVFLLSNLFSIVKNYARLSNLCYGCPHQFAQTRARCFTM